MERTASNLLGGILRKMQMNSKRIVRMFTIKRNGMKVIVDDDVVRELPDGQDMVVRFSKVVPGDASSISPDDPMDFEVILTFR